MITRFNPDTETRREWDGGDQVVNRDYAVMMPCPDGEYVRFEEHIAALAQVWKQAIWIVKSVETYRWVRFSGEEPDTAGNFQDNAVRALEAAAGRNGSE
jgi:hypothetical protein